MIINKPPMGWNSWNTFARGVNERVIREAADAMAETGLRDAGYEYVVIDDCWSLKERGPDGRLVPNPETFPSGMNALSDYIHSKGLKFGMYSCAGIMTCTGAPGSYDKEFIDAETFAGWGVDYLKYDFCHFPAVADPRESYSRMAMALETTGRDIVFSACNGGLCEVEKWIRSTGAHLYRCTTDITETFPSILEHCRSQDEKIRYSAPGCYNDMDMLVVGMDGIGHHGHPGLCGDTEYKTHFALWCLFGQPLMMGSDLRRLRPETLELLTNKDLLRIDQDAECRPPIESGIKGDSRPSFFKHLSDRQFAVAFFNFTDEDGCADFRPWDIGLTTSAGVGMSLREVFTGEVVGPVNDFLSLYVPARDCKVFIGEWVTM